MTLSQYGSITITAEAVATSRAWLHTCQDSHASCAKPARIATFWAQHGWHFMHELEKGKRMPRRLLRWTVGERAGANSSGAAESTRLENENSTQAPDVTDPLASTSVAKSATSQLLGIATITVSIVDLGEKAEDTPYVALSHRWGGNESCKLLKSNSQAWEKPSDLANLPLLFQDAVVFAHGLGFCQIWIDQLCILQDDENDWQSEGRRMGVIFGNATVTIAAEDAENSAAGLCEENSDGKSLDSRAWVAQERILTPRTLRCNRHGVGWECRVGDARPGQQAIMVRRAISIPEEDWDFANNLWPPDEDQTDPTSTFAVEDNESDAVEDGEAGDQAQGGKSDEQLPEQYVTGNSLYPMVRKVRRRSLGSFADFEDHCVHDPRQPIFEKFDHAFQRHLRTIRIPSHPKDIFCFFRDFRLPTLQIDLKQTDFAYRYGSLEGKFEDYNQFLRVWWRFITSYSERQLSKPSDRFLAMQGVSGLAQRWTQLQASFGLWHHFMPAELMWFIDPTGPAGRRYNLQSFRVPTFSWAYMDEGRVVNLAYERLPSRTTLMLHNRVQGPIRTSYDQPIPYHWYYKAFRESGWMGLTGDLRRVQIRLMPDLDGGTSFQLTVESETRRSDDEQHEFRADCLDNFELEWSYECYMLHVVHYDREKTGWPHYLDVHLVLSDIRIDSDGIEALNTEQARKRHAKDARCEPWGRPMIRNGYMETTYKEKLPESELQTRWQQIRLF